MFLEKISAISMPYLSGSRGKIAKVPGEFMTFQKMSVIQMTKLSCRQMITSTFLSNQMITPNVIIQSGDNTGENPGYKTNCQGKCYHQTR
jgi:hypothetical protein